MNKIHPTVLASLNQSLIGRIKLQIFKYITGKHGYSPSSTQRNRYAKEVGQSNDINWLEINAYINNDFRYTIVKAKDLWINSVELFRPDFTV